MNTLLTLEEFMAKHKIARSTVYKWVKEGMPKSNLGKSVRFDQDKTDAWIIENKLREG